MRSLRDLPFYDGREYAPDDIPIQEWLIREIAEHLTISQSKGIAWYEIPPARWDFLSEGQRFAWKLDQANGFLQLIGKRVYTRVTAWPFDHIAWAKDHAKMTTNPLPGYDNWLVGAQRRIKKLSSYEKYVFQGVELPARSFLERGYEWVRKQTSEPEIARMFRQAKRIEANAISRLGGTPLTPEQMQWLLARSFAIGMPSWKMVNAQNEYGLQDLAHIFDTVDWSVDGHFQKCIRVRFCDPHTDQITEHYVTVICIGKAPRINLLEMKHSPWLTIPDDAGFPYEMLLIEDIVPGNIARKEAEKAIKAVVDMRAAYREHDLLEPPEYRRQAAQALAANDQMVNGTELYSTRIRTYGRIAVWGDTPQECLERAETMANLFRDRHFKVGHPRGQYRVLREFVPNEPQSTKAYRNQTEVLYRVSGAPQVSTRLGDRQGWPLGATINGSPSPVLFNPFYAITDLKRSGVFLIDGENGCGKSLLAQLLAYYATQSGIHTTYLNPTGPLTGLSSLFPNNTRVIDIDRSPPGTLSPWRLIPTPEKAAYRDPKKTPEQNEAEWKRAIANAKSERRDRALDLSIDALPWDIVEDSRTRGLLRVLINEVGGEEDRHFGQVIELLQEMYPRKPGVNRSNKKLRISPTSEEALVEKILNAILDERDNQYGALYFGTPDFDLRWTRPDEEFDAMLTIVNIPGVDAPRTTERKYWQTKQRRSLILTRQAVEYTSRAIYTREMTTPKLILLDEAKILEIGGGESTDVFVSRVALDTRKWRAAIGWISQLPSHLMRFGLSTLASTVFMGHLEGEEAQTDACTMLNIPTNAGYQTTFGTLNPNATRNPKSSQLYYRDWVIRDAHNQVGVFRIDMRLQPELLRAFDPTAKLVKVA